nr:vegetative cell wall protein gp1-like [Aegilops tauschii subsp. strangulata]
MSLPPPPPALSCGSTAPMTTVPPLTAPMTTTPPVTAPMTSAAGTTALAGLVSTVAPAAPPSPVPSAPPLSAVFTPEQVTATLRDLVTTVQGLHLQHSTGRPSGCRGAPLALGADAVIGPLAAPADAAGGGHRTAASLHRAAAAAVLGGTPGETTPAAAPLWYLQPPTPVATDAPAHSAPPTLQPPAPPLPSSGAPPPTGLPLHQVRFPPSPSPLPAWAARSSPSPVYTTAPAQSTPFPQFGGPSGSAGPYPEYSDQAPPASLLGTSEPARYGVPSQAPPRFAKIDFATYDGTEDPLNWLNQCDQFFCG